jgi:3',5'-cyclic-nucleotide phosphodiesterase
MTGDESHGMRGENLEAEMIEERDGKGIVVMEQVKILKKKPSRFRMNFWKRSKTASPPVPVQVGGVKAGSEEEVNQG